MKKLTIALSMLISITTFSQSIIVQLHAKIPEWKLQDGCNMYFDSTFLDGYNYQDALKFNNIHETVAIENNDRLLALERRSSFETIALKLWNMRGLEYKLIIYARDLPRTAALEDTWENKVVPVTDTTEYFFTSGTSVIEGRFRIMFPGTLSIVPDPVRPLTPVSASSCIYPNPSTGVVNIKMPPGKYIVSFIGSNQVETFNHIGNITTGLPGGMYHVIITDERGKRLVKLLEIRK